MSHYWKFTNRILCILAIIALPVIHFSPGQKWRETWPTLCWLC